MIDTQDNHFGRTVLAHPVATPRSVRSLYVNDDMPGKNNAASVSDNAYSEEEQGLRSSVHRPHRTAVEQYRYYANTPEHMKKSIAAENVRALDSRFAALVH